MGEVTMWLPSGLDLHERMARAGLGPQTVYAEWLVSEVVRWGMLHRVPAGEFVPLAFAHLRTGVPHNLVARVKAAVVPEVVETDGEYWFTPAGGGEPGKCLGYRLAGGWASTPVEKVRRVACELGRKLARAAEERARRQQEVLDRLPPVYRLLWGHMSGARLTADGAADSHPVVEHLTGRRPRWFVVCAQGRVHHPVASCPRRLRRHLRLGESDAPLTLVDVSTSQPLLMGLFVSTIATPPPTHRTPDTPPPPPDHLYAACNDTRSFVNECLSGDLYTTLARRMSELDPGGRVYGRAEGKEAFMRAMYGRAGGMDKQPGGLAVRSLYPGFFRRVQDLAFRSRHGDLARRMQRLESGLMVGGVAGELDRRLPAAPFVTLHDAVLAHSAHAAEVTAVIRETYSRRFGVTPRLKEEQVTATAVR